MSPTKKLREKNGRFISQKTASMAPSVKSSTQVFNTPELLETILLKLSMKDLLFSQRVCSSWRALSISSIQLRRALFLQPASAETVSYIDWRLDDKGFYREDAAKLNLGEPLRGVNGDRKPKAYKSHWGQTRDDDGKFRVFVNPLLSTIFPFLSAGSIYYGEQLQDFPKGMMNPEASWARMYLTQPVVNFMAIEWDSEEEGQADWTITSLQKAPGVTGVQMLDLFARFRQIDRPAWIEGRELWEEWEGPQDLARIVRGSRG